MAPPLSAAEMQRRYRAKRDADPERRAEYLQKEREKWQRGQETGKKKKIADLSEPEQRAQRKKWRQRKREAKLREKARAAIPSSPTTPLGLQPVAGPSRQRQQGQRLQNKQKKKLEREIKLLKAALAKEKSKKEKYKKKWQRSQTKGQTQSPRTQLNQLLKHPVLPSSRRKLLLHASVVEELRKKYHNTRKQKDKQVLARATMGNVIKKYRLQRLAQQTLGFSKKRARLQGNLCSYQRTTRQRQTKRQAVVAYYLRDDVSRMTTGKKQTITLQKKKMQKRLLTDTVKNICMKFVSESTHQVSYSFFYSQRPFWVVAPTEADREICQCKTHENLQFMSTSLFSSGLLSTKDVEKMADTIVCDPNLKDCAYCVCGECHITAVALVRPTTTNSIALTQWSTEVSKDEKKSTVTVKKEIMLTEDEAVEQFQNRMAKFRQHIFNIRWQYRAYRELREKLTDNECLIHIDFSENYVCKYTNKVQSVHFGGSHQQATLHTGVLYTSLQSPLSFCSISPSRRHDPLAIWAHLDPVLEMVKEKFPQVQRLHFFSNGPATQYKQKGNFFLLCTEPFKRGFDISWNFFEASHGKGAPGGIGGTLERSANRLVRLGEDIPNAEVLFQKLNMQESSVQLFYVTERSVEEMLAVPPLTAVKGTMKIHQIMSTSPGKIKYRDITCLCQKEKGVMDCPCFELKEATLQDVVAPDVPTTEPLWRPEVITSDHVGRWCVVRYDDGIIMAVEENNIQVNCMHRNGVNKFFWPGPRKDVSWYADSQVLCLIEEPEALNKRSVQLDMATWRYVEEQIWV